ncbi:Phosphatidylserine/phosphatidylglycerophosphate/cardiolipin synthase [Marinobacter pelagius]|uniref:Phosphatidylserine/phosphatidylglycerophosphate/cardiolipin synthase n=2 Tax=Marinobacter pelagius TaxID=379482 RepID=A0A1I4RNP4_9GAMM|nr:phospholipase D family protein [Marinobacter pelagius]SFM53610.1 Phosphatidylserine/phosphatidylglycerophosphate/cardiolipin synthase [Marinobacter pelagius]
MLSGCALPPLADRPDSRSIPQSQTRETVLGQAITPKTEAHPGQSGVVLLPDPYDAFAARALLAEAAEASLDVQYYIWRPDTTGSLMLYTLYRAAERGVRVRLLLDDNGIAGMDDILAALSQHPNIEIRLFNPFVVRNPKWLGYFTDFRRLNYRMHNKSFTADNQATIIGGRNIADEYFGAAQGAMFADLDVLAIGPAVDEVSRDFDRYWASSYARTARQILGEPGPEPLAALAESFRTTENSDAASVYARTLEDSAFLRSLLARELAFSWAPVVMVSDDPAKVLGGNNREDLLSRQLARALDDPERSITLVSPYFIPRDAGVELFRKLEERGVEVRVLTNSLEANDVAMVHAGYSKYRKPLLRAGVELWEMRRLDDEPPRERDLQSGMMGSSASSLHAKTFAVDGETLFVGSFNFDPRSIHLNTELGFVIESPELARVLEREFDQQVRFTAYRVVLNEDGELRWLEQQEHRTVTYSHEPGTGPLKRMLVFFWSLMPIESLL